MCNPLPSLDGSVIAVICPVQKNPLSTIIHESVHVWQQMMEYIVEATPGIETEAYTIEYVSMALLEQYQKLTGEKIAIPEKRKTRLQAGASLGAQKETQSGA